MSRSWAVLAVGLGLWAAAVGRADDNGVPVPPAAPVAHPAAPCGACGCDAHCRRGCLRQLLDWFTYCSRPVPPCCHTCCACRDACMCYPQLYTFFLTGPSSCQHATFRGAAWGGPDCHGAPVVPASAVAPPASPAGPGEVAPVDYSLGPRSDWRPAAGGVRQR
jgi:hypothetical protein